MNSELPPGFRGLRWEPTDEQDVVVLFGRLLDHLPRPLAIENVRTGFPDCRATDSETGEAICIEFELKSSHFVRDHSERTEKCDWIVCWRDDLDTKPPEFPQVVALDGIVAHLTPPLVLNRLSATARPVDVFRARAAGLPIPQQRIIERLLTFGGAGALRIDWPETNGACFTVRGPIAGLGDIEYFKVSSAGRVGVAFSRWKGAAADIRSDVAVRLNEAVGSESFSGRGKTGRHISELFRTDASVDQFIRVWQEVGAKLSQTRPGGQC
jgi:hypothetical protein